MEDKLDMTYYSGQDLYSDGDVEESILQAVQPGGDIEQCLMEGDSWPHLYHLSNIRENILDWYDFDKDGSLLEIGSGCGALTGLFCRKVSRVVAVELSKRRSMINATRNRQYDNFTIMLGNFEDIKIEEKFDYVTLIGVFEYSICYISSEDPFMDMLRKAKSFLKPGGKLIIAIENKYGMKYFAGASEDHTGRCFDGLENYASVGRVRTFSHKTLEGMLEKAGFFKNEFYYPMPDYKLPSEIYSDKHLPAFGSIRNACVSYDRERYELIDERLAFDSVCEDGMFGEFANSFLVISGQGTQDGYQPEAVTYAKYNRLRAPRFQVSTRVITAQDGTRRVEKEALREEAKAHIKRLSKNLQKLSAACPPPGPSGIPACPVPVRILANEDGRALFPYIEGVGLDREVHRCIGKKDTFLAAMHEALRLIYGTYQKGTKGLADFTVTDKFVKVFGKPEGLQETMQGMKSLRVSNIDSILSNFIKKPDGSIACLDYEWVFDFPVPVEYLIYRTVFYYFSENRAYIQKYISEQDYLSEFGLDGQKAAIFRQMDDRFQQFVHGKGRKYMYTSRYEKKSFNIGSNLQGGEGWFLSIVNDIDRLNHELGEYRRDLVVCRVDMHRKSEKEPFLNRCAGKCKSLAKGPHKIRKALQKLQGRSEG